MTSGRVKQTRTDDLRSCGRGVRVRSPEAGVGHAGAAHGHRTVARRAITDVSPPVVGLFHPESRGRHDGEVA